MSRHRDTRGKGRKKSPGTKKGAKNQKEKITKKKGTAAKKPHWRQGKKFPGERKARFEKGKAARKALGKSGPGPEGEFVERGPDGTFAIINDLPEKGCEGNECRCNDPRRSSCKAHPSRIKVRTGRKVVEKDGKSRCLWVLKALVEVGHVEVEEPVEECA